MTYPFLLCYQAFFFRGGGGAYMCQCICMVNVGTMTAQNDIAQGGGGGKAQNPLGAPPPKKKQTLVVSAEIISQLNHSCHS